MLGKVEGDDDQILLYPITSCPRYQRIQNSRSPSRWPGVFLCAREHAAFWRRGPGCKRQGSGSFSGKKRTSVPWCRCPGCCLRLECARLAGSANLRGVADDRDLHEIDAASGGVFEEAMPHRDTPRRSRPHNPSLIGSESRMNGTCRRGDAACSARSPLREGDIIRESEGSGVIRSRDRLLRSQMICVPSYRSPVEKPEALEAMR